jgi:putative sigma-54 modulation protein
MQIDVKGRHVTVTDTLREQVERRFAKVAKQVNGSAWLEVELSQERNPANPMKEIAEATIHLKGVTLRAREASRDMPHAINLVADDIARQVKRVRDKRRGPRAGAPFEAPTAEGFDQPAAGAM